MYRIRRLRDTTMRTQTPTSPFDIAGVDMAQYGEPQHELSVTSTDQLYGPPQHESHVEDPEWLISVARRTFSTVTQEPVRDLHPDTEPEPEPEPQKEALERAVVRQ